MQPIKESTFLISDPFLPFTAFINKNVSTKVHWHNYIELLYVISGSAQLTIDCDNYYVSPGDFLIINSQEPHAANFSKDTFSEILVIQFEPSMINSNFSSVFQSKYIIPFINHQVDYQKHTKLAENSELRILLNEILDEFTAKQHGYELKVMGDILKLFCWIVRNIYKAQRPNSETLIPDLLRLKSLFDYVNSHYNEGITSEMASKIACMSYNHFCRFFKRVTGKTFIEYLNYVRLHESEILLLNTDDTITNIAAAVGFPSISYYNRLFKRNKGLSPLSFRKQICSINNQV